LARDGLHNFVPFKPVTMAALDSTSILVFLQFYRDQKGPEKGLTADCGRRIKPLSLQVGSTGA